MSNVLIEEMLSQRLGSSAKEATLAHVRRDRTAGSSLRAGVQGLRTDGVRQKQAWGQRGAGGGFPELLSWLRPW